GCVRAAHSLKSMSFSIGAARVARRAHEVELRSREDNDAIDAGAVAAVKQALADAMQEIERRIGVIATDDKPAGAPAPVATREPENDMARAMQRGLEQNQFSLLYQPIVDPAGAMIGVEALMRWSPRPDQQVPPTVFIPVAETSGLIHDMGHWAVERALVDSQTWEGIDISINVSPVQLMRSDFVDRVERAVSTCCSDPKRVVLEITESTVLSAEAAVERMMERLCAHGIRFALDDFGTGYASLASLRRFPFNRIKIDRSFVSN